MPPSAWHLPPCLSVPLSVSPVCPVGTAFPPRSGSRRAAGAQRTPAPCAPSGPPRSSGHSALSPPAWGVPAAASPGAAHPCGEEALCPAPCWPLRRAGSSGTHCLAGGLVHREASHHVRRAGALRALAGERLARTSDSGPSLRGAWCRRGSRSGALLTHSCAGRGVSRWSPPWFWKRSQSVLRAGGRGSAGGDLAQAVPAESRRLRCVWRGAQQVEASLQLAQALPVGSTFRSRGAAWERDFKPSAFCQESGTRGAGPSTRREQRLSRCSRRAARPGRSCSLQPRGALRPSPPSPLEAAWT